jgi:hypothetical protein
MIKPLLRRGARVHPIIGIVFGFAPAQATKNRLPSCEEDLMRYVSRVPTMFRHWFAAMNTSTCCPT